MPQLDSPAIVLSTLRYSETSKIVRLATREHGVQSAIAKGALRPRSRFGAALQFLSEGQARLLVKEHRELHILAGFDLLRLHAGLAADLERYATASALAEVMLRFAPADPHPESYDLLRDALGLLEVAPAAELEALGFRLLWQLVGSLGFAPALDACVRDGTPLPADGGLAFSTREGGALCPACAAGHGATHLPPDARADLGALLAAGAMLPRLDRRHAEAHRRLLARYVRFHLGEGAELPALDFWLRRPWVAA
jgi:DNA repair protein RecO (recombination protein O)